MGETRKKSKTMSAHGFTSFELTKDLLNNLKQFEITPTAKLVLLYLSSCYNPDKATMFPKQKTIANKIGVSERSVVRAVQELFKAGLIIIECKYTNRYKFTSKIGSERLQNEKIFTSENMSDNECQNVIKQSDKLSDTCIEQIKRKNKTTNDEILMKAVESKKGIKNKVAYINAIKRNGGAEQIIKEVRQMEAKKQYMQNSTKEFIQNFEESKEKSTAPSEKFKALKGKLLRT